MIPALLLTILAWSYPPLEPYETFVQMRQLRVALNDERAAELRRTGGIHSLWATHGYVDAKACQCGTQELKITTEPPVPADELVVQINRATVDLIVKNAEIVMDIKAQIQRLRIRQEEIAYEHNRTRQLLSIYFALVFVCFLANAIASRFKP